MKWNTNLYDDKHEFVSKYGEAVIELLAPQAGERILDLGCGTGHLAETIRAKGALVVGIDSSAEMIATAKQQYPMVDFELQSAHSFRLSEPLDAVFSNAALHWVLQKEAAIARVYDCLKPGGRFVAEFGGKGNIAHILQALRKALYSNGHIEQSEKELWYFPSIGEYTGLLEQAGFRVTFAAHFNRDTPLKNADGIKNWVRMFGEQFLQGLSAAQTEKVLDSVETQIRPTNYKNNSWYADYVRLRIVAVK